MRNHETMEGKLTEVEIARGRTFVHLFNKRRQSASYLVLNSEVPLIVGGYYTIKYEPGCAQTVSNTLISATYHGIADNLIWQPQQDETISDLQAEIIDALQQYTNNVFNEESLYYALEDIDFTRYL